jgi:hypothetical protein
MSRTKRVKAFRLQLDESCIADASDKRDARRRLLRRHRRRQADQRECAK